VVPHVAAHQVHLYSFNQIAATVEWQQQVSGRLAA
jgi:hypothetical protein